MRKGLKIRGAAQWFAGLCMSPIALSYAEPIPPKLTIDYEHPTAFVVDHVAVTGADSIDDNLIQAALGIQPGDVVVLPGQRIAAAIKRIWKQHLVDDIAIQAVPTSTGHVDLVVQVKAYQRLLDYTYKGLDEKKFEQLVPLLGLEKGRSIGPNYIEYLQKTIREHLQANGYPNTVVTVHSHDTDGTHKGKKLCIEVKKGKKTYVKALDFHGHHYFKANLLKRNMSHTKVHRPDSFIRRGFWDCLLLRPIRHGGFMLRPLRWFEVKSYLLDGFWTLFPQNFDQTKYAEDKRQLLNLYQNKGFSDAQLQDQVIATSQGDKVIHIQLHEGRQYFVRHITWVGNTLHTAETLSKRLQLVTGSPYCKAKLEQQLMAGPEAVVGVYRNNGYLFAYITLHEVRVDGNQVDLELRVHEGKPAYINNVIIRGNRFTSEHIIRRALLTLPGERFDMRKLIISQHKLARLGVIDPHSLQVNPIPDEASNTVDIEYVVKESMRIDFRASWRGFTGPGASGTFSLSLNNFALGKLFRPSQWHPFPIGHAQEIGFSFTKERKFHQLSLNFSDPWLFGKQATALYTSAYLGKQIGEGHKKHSPSTLYTKGISLGLSRYLSHYWNAQVGFNYSRYSYTSFDIINELRFTSNEAGRKQGKSLKHTGKLHGVRLNVGLVRDTKDNPLYPSQGTVLGLHARFTPPYELFCHQTKTTAGIKQIGIHQWLLDVEAYYPLWRRLVGMAGVHAGIVGTYHTAQNPGPFGRFMLGGEGYGFGDHPILGRESIGLRGYPTDYVPLNPRAGKNRGGVAFNKVTLELRYPLVTNNIVTLFVLTFAEGGATWAKYHKINPFKLQRAIGFGFRALLPMIGMIGIDWGWGLDKRNKSSNPELAFQFGLQTR